MIENLRPYDEYKNCSLAWLERIPLHWQEELGFGIFREKQEKNVGLREKRVLSLSYGRVVIKPEEKLRGLVPESFETYQIVNPGDLVIRGTDLQNDWTSLRVGLVRDRGIITSAYICLQNGGLLHPEYAFLILHTYDLLKFYYGLGSGLRQNLSFRDFRRLPFPIPPLDEQAAIVRFLDHANRRIDRFIRAKKKLIGLLNEQKQAIIHRAVTRGIDPNVPMKESGVPWLGTIPRHWEVRKLKNLIASGSSISYGIVQPGDHIENGVPFLQTTNISGVVLRLDRLQRTSPVIAASYPRSRIVAGDVVLGIRASIGAAHVVLDDLTGANLSRGVARIVPNVRVIEAHYLVLFLRSAATARYWDYSKQGSTFSEVAISTVKMLPVVVPGLDEQRRINDWIGCDVAPLDRAISRYEHEISLILEYRTRLIADVVTGQLDIREAARALPVLNDEPDARDDPDEDAADDDKDDDDDLDMSNDA